MNEPQMNTNGLESPRETAFSSKFLPMERVTLWMKSGLFATRPGLVFVRGDSWFHIPFSTSLFKSHHVYAGFSWRRVIRNKWIKQNNYQQNDFPDHRISELFCSNHSVLISAFGSGSAGLGLMNKDKPELPTGSFLGIGILWAEGRFDRRRCLQLHI